MDPNIVIRDETPDDIAAITEVTVAAFETLEISNHTELFIIKALRANVSGLLLEGVPQEVFFALSFDGHIPQGTVTFHKAIMADGQ